RGSHTAGERGLAGRSAGARLTTIERLGALQIAAREGDPLIFVYGPCTDDAFVDTGYRICDLELAVWEILRAAGFQRVGFYSLTDKLYFRDDESARAARPGRAAGSTVGPR